MTKAATSFAVNNKPADDTPAVSFGRPLSLSVLVAMSAAAAVWWMGGGLLLALLTYVGAGIVVLVGAMALKVRGRQDA